MGTAIIVKGADFSKNNIGTITFGSLSERIVNKYNSAIGTNEYQGPLSQMVNSLIEESLWDKIVALYPILGDSLNAKCVNLASDGAYPMRLKENAANGDKLISFSNTIEVSANDDSLPIYAGRAFGYGFIVDYVRTEWGNNTSNLFSIGSGGLTTSLKEGGRAIKIGLANSRGVESTPASEKYPESRHLYSYVNEAAESKLYVDGILNNTNSATSQNSNAPYSGYFGSTAVYNPTSTVGSPISANQNIGSGEMRFFLYGAFTNDELVKATDIVQEFLTTVGKQQSNSVSLCSKECI